jgi:molybdopterin synthase catalytic subunit
MRAWITTQPIAAQDVLDRVGAAADGAAVVFLGMVREENDGRRVSGLRYDAYAAMAEEVLRDIAEEAGRRAGTDRVAVVHRVGELAVGDVSVAIAVSSPHRVEAFDAARYTIESIKQRLPVWKQEHYVDAAPRWLGGATPAAGP